MITLVNLVLYVPHYQLLIKKMVKVSLKEYTLAFFYMNFKQFLNLIYEWIQYFNRFNW